MAIMSDFYDYHIIADEGETYSDEFKRSYRLIQAEWDQRKQAVRDMRHKLGLGWNTPAPIEEQLRSFQKTLTLPKECTTSDLYAIITPEGRAQFESEMKAALGELSAIKERADHEARELARLKHEAEVLDLIPEEFRASIDRSLLKNPSAHDAVMAYDPANADGRGLLCYGDTGRAKTRSVFRRLYEYAITCESIPFVAYTAAELKRIAIDQSRQRGGSLVDLLNGVQVVFIDDIGMASFTPVYQEQLHELLERRTTHKQPTIITSQFNAAGLLRKLSGYEGQYAKEVEAILRRIGDYCDRVDFGTA